MSIWSLQDFTNQHLVQNHYIEHSNNIQAYIPCSKYVYNYEMSTSHLHLTYCLHYGMEQNNRSLEEASLCR